MATGSKFSPEVRGQAVRLVEESQGEPPSGWAAICSVAAKLGCGPETLRKWIRQAEIDSGRRPGCTTADPAERWFRACRGAGDAELGGLVQQPAVAGTDRLRAAAGVRGDV